MNGVIVLVVLLFIWKVYCVIFGLIFICVNIGMKINVINVYLVVVEIIIRLMVVVNNINKIKVYKGFVCIEDSKLVFMIVIYLFKCEYFK